MGYSGADADAGKIDIEPFMEAALEDVIAVILIYGEYPKPPSDKQRRKFDLYEFAEENIEPSDVLECYVLMLTESAGSSVLYDKQRDMAKDMEKRLREELAGSELVCQRAEELYYEAKE